MATRQRITSSNKPAAKEDKQRRLDKKHKEWQHPEYDIEYCFNSFIVVQMERGNSKQTISFYKQFFNKYKCYLNDFYKQTPNPKPTPTPAQQNNNLTLQENNATIQLDIDQQTAQARVEEIQDISILHLNKYDASHTQHAYEITGLPQGTTPRELYQRYEEIATEFFKREIDGVVVDGFIDRDGTLHKFNRETGIYGRLFNNNKFGSIYKLDGDTEKRWEKYKKRFLKEE